MQDKTSICNFALGQIGHTKRIADIESERSAEAEACRTYYDVARRNALSDFPWSFTKRVANLAILTGETHPLWGLVYAMPADCLEPIAIIQEGINQVLADTQTLYYTGQRLNGHTIPESLRVPFSKGLTADGKKRTILTNQEDAILEYKADIEDASLFTSSFAEAVGWRMAAYLANAIAKSPSLAQQAQSYYNMIGQQAAAQDLRGEKDLMYPIPESITSRIC